LILYTDDNFENTHLICYIELFSTFQFYVILNENYIGDKISKSYSQSVLKREKYEHDIDSSSTSDLLIIAEELGLKNSDFSGKSNEEVKDLLKNTQKQTQISYQNDLDSIMKALIQNPSFIYLVMDKEDTLSSLVNEQLLDAIPDLTIEDKLVIQAEIERIENDDTINFFRQNYLDFEEGIIKKNNLNEMIKLIKDNEELVKRYTFLKFFQLSLFIQKNK